ncbi:hypothetical protein ACFY9R_29140 [Streptomyces albidoflavus]|uniref:DUF6197 family protein n=1 Tax=Streptomyces albidoflavus TaxID=1886 RepID=UPI0033C80391
MTTPTPVDVADVLDRAADHIDRVGWTQGDWYMATSEQRPEDCSVCAMGAISLTLTGNPTPPGPDEEIYGQMVDLSDLVISHIEVLGVDLPSWNDEPGRTKEHVLSAFRSTATALREEVAS